MGRLDGKIAIVTGAASGIGAATAAALAVEGARVVVADLDEDGAIEQAAGIRAAGADAIAVAADISNETAVERLVEQTLTAYGRIDVLHNNAAATRLGGTVDGPVREADLAVWTKTLLVSLCGTMLVTKHVLGPMLDQGSGSIVNTSSGRPEVVPSSVELRWRPR
jgi:NAD(P)-dependent dehydrogenase (short-subunit alcohol dehydrogenase family)